MTTHSMRGVQAARARVFARVAPRYAFELVVDLAAATFSFAFVAPIFPRQSALTPTPACRFRTIPSLDVVFQPRETKDGFLGHLRETLWSLSLLNTDAVTSTRPRLCAIGLHFSP